MNRADNLKIHIYIQARESSERLPSKILKKICDKSILELIVERVNEIKDVNKIVLVTGSKEKNKKLIEQAEKLNIEYFCGNDDNILDRFHTASLSLQSKIIIRITGDCPLIDFDLINKGLQMFKENDYDILSINRFRTFPDGFDFEIFNVDALHEAWSDLKSKFKQKDFEQSFIPPTKYLLEKKKFKHFDLRNEEDLSGIRLTLDYLEDFQLIKTIYEKLYYKNRKFAMSKILELITTNKELLDINKKYVTKDYGLKIEN